MSLKASKNILKILDQFQQFTYTDINMNTIFLLQRFTLKIKKLPRKHLKMIGIWSHKTYW